MTLVSWYYEIQVKVELWVAGLAKWVMGFEKLDRGFN